MSDTVTVTSQIPNELASLLNRVAEAEERSKSYYIKKGLELILRQRLEDLEDYEAAVAGACRASRLRRAARCRWTRCSARNELACRVRACGGKTDRRLARGGARPPSDVPSGRNLLADPPRATDPLMGALRGYAKFRVGDCRLICHRDDGVLLVLVIKADHRQATSTASYRTASITASCIRQSRITSAPQRRGCRSLVRQMRASWIMPSVAGDGDGVAGQGRGSPR